MYQKGFASGENITASLKEPELQDSKLDSGLEKQHLLKSGQLPVGDTAEEQVKLGEFEKRSCHFLLLFFLIGLLNNNTYVVINTGAQDLAEKFGKKNLMGAFQMYARLTAGA